MNWVEVKSIGITTDKKQYNVGDTVKVTVNVETGDGTVASGRIMVYGIVTLIHTLSLAPNSNYSVDFTFQVPEISAGDYVLTAEVDEYVSGPTPV